MQLTHVHVGRENAAYFSRVCALDKMVTCVSEFGYIELPDISDYFYINLFIITTLNCTDFNNLWHAWSVSTSWIHALSSSKVCCLVACIHIALPISKRRNQQDSGISFALTSFSATEAGFQNIHDYLLKNTSLCCPQHCFCLLQYCQVWHPKYMQRWHYS